MAWNASLKGLHLTFFVVWHYIKEIRIEKILTQWRYERNCHWNFFFLSKNNVQSLTNNFVLLYVFLLDHVSDRGFDCSMTKTMLMNLQLQGHANLDNSDSYLSNNVVHWNPMKSTPYVKLRPRRSCELVIVTACSLDMWHDEGNTKM